MNDRSTADRLQRAYEHIGPRGELKTNVLSSLPESRSAPRCLARRVFLFAAACLIAMLAFWPDPAEPPPVGPGPAPARLEFTVDGDPAEVVRIMAARLDARGIEGFEVTTGIGGSVEAVVPPDVDRTELVGLLTRSGTLAFRIVYESKDGEEIPPGVVQASRIGGGDPVYLEPVDDPEFEFVGEDLDPDGFLVGPSPMGFGFMIGFELLPDRREAFAEFTEGNLGRKLAIVVEGEVSTTPIIMDRLPGRAIISGPAPSGFTEDEALSLVAALKAGPYPSDVRPVELR